MKAEMLMVSLQDCLIIFVRHCNWLKFWHFSLRVCLEILLELRFGVYAAIKSWPHFNMGPIYPCMLESLINKNYHMFFVVLFLFFRTPVLCEEIQVSCYYFIKTYHSTFCYFFLVQFTDFKNYAMTASLKDNPKLERSIALFNGLSQWIQCMVLSKTTPQQRADVIVKFCNVAKVC